VTDLALRTLPADLALLALLISGHVMADFLVQTKRVAARKGRHFGVLLLHGLLTIVTHAVLLLPFWSPVLIAPLIALGAYHLLLDLIKGRLDDPAAPSGRLRPFAVDQALHGIGLLAVWVWLLDLDAHRHTLALVPAQAIPALAAWSVVLAGLVFNGKGGTAVVRGLLAQYPTLLPRREAGDATSASAPDEYEMGRTIGILERTVVYVLVLIGQWGTLGLVIAAKSIARFSELKNQRFADYYLLGTLASILTALLTGLVVRLTVLV
jgi:hypothetical protein